MVGSPIDLDSGEEGVGAMVPVTPESPSKRSKTLPACPSLPSSSNLEQQPFVSLIQTTIQDSVKTSLKPIHDTVEALLEKITVQNTRLEQAITSLEMLESSHSRRTNTMRRGIGATSKVTC